MVRGKGGWIRILEATIAVILIAGVLVILYAKQPQHSIQAINQIENTHKLVLKEISTNDVLRNDVLNDDIIHLNQTVYSLIPSHIGYSVRICDLSLPCKLDSVTFKETLSKDVLAQGTVISSNITDYNPKKVMLFLWYR